MKSKAMKCVVMTFWQYIKISLETTTPSSNEDDIFTVKEKIFMYLFSIIASLIVVGSLLFVIMWLKIETQFGIAVLIIGVIIMLSLIARLFIFLRNTWQKAIQDCWDKV